MKAPVVLRLKKKKKTQQEEHSAFILINVYFHFSCWEKILIYDYYDYCEDDS